MTAQHKRALQSKLARAEHLKALGYFPDLAQWVKTSPAYRIFNVINSRCTVCGAVHKRTP